MLDAIHVVVDIHPLADEAYLDPRDVLLPSSYVYSFLESEIPVAVTGASLDERAAELALRTFHAEQHLASPDDFDLVACRVSSSADFPAGAWHVPSLSMLIEDFLGVGLQRAP